MTIKDKMLLSNDIKQLKPPFNNNQNHQYSNLDLNQNHKCFDESCVHLNSKSYSNYKSYISLFDEKFGRKEIFQSAWNKSTLIKSKNAFVEVEEEKSEKKLYKKVNTFSNKNKRSSSTLSLHIAAYENSFENENTVSLVGNKNEKSIDLMKKLKKISVNPTSVIQNSFEFPRQQMDVETEPAIMQFKASQQLLNPNQLECSKNGIPRSEITVAGYNTTICDCFYGFEGEFCENVSKSRHWMLVFFWIFIAAMVILLLLALLRQKFQTRYRPPHKKLRFVDVLNRNLKD